MLTYAKAGETPCSHLLRIVDAATGEELHEVVEINTEEGWLRRFQKGADGKPVIKGEEFVIERIEGRFRIETLPGYQGIN